MPDNYGWRTAVRAFADTEARHSLGSAPPSFRFINPGDSYASTSGSRRL